VKCIVNYIGYLESNGRVMMNGDLGITWQNAIVGQFNVLSEN